MTGLMSAGGGENFVEKLYFGSSANWYTGLIQETTKNKYKRIDIGGATGQTDIVKFYVRRNGSSGSVIDITALKPCEVECVYTTYDDMYNCFTTSGRVEIGENIIPRVSTTHDSREMIARITILKVYE